MLRTHNCGELRKSDQKSQVTLCGWVDQVRDMGQLLFIVLRDRYGVTQCLVDKTDLKEDSKLLKVTKSIGYEDCLQLTGHVRLRGDKDRNPKQATGEVELFVASIEVLNKSQTLPFPVRDDHQASDELRLKHRYLDLRRPKMQKNMMTRHLVIQAIRDVLVEQGFLEIETPLLIRSTPEGARDFLVPSRTHRGNFYSLPQSPQLYKQILMMSGCDRYFQFAPAFRDEDLRADRVPVFSQVDMEMTFVDEEDVFRSVESYVTHVFAKVRGETIEAPFPIMTYAKAMELYGSDKPDTRFGCEIQTVTELAKQTSFGVFQNAQCVRALVVEDGTEVSRKVIESWEAKAKNHGAKGLAWARLTGGKFTGGVSKFLDPQSWTKALSLSEGALVLFVADSYQVACKALGAVRLEVGKHLNLIDKSAFNFLWVNEFPLFEWNPARDSFDASHHLFSQPRQEDLHWLDSDPGKVRGQVYDLVLNGVEILSGSIRICDPEIQQKVLDVVKMSREEARNKFGFLMDAMSYGAPPHGGSALGLDRFIALMCGEESIREVIAFPSNNTGIFPLDGSPGLVNPEQLEELGLVIKEKKDS